MKDNIISNNHADIGPAMRLIGSSLNKIEDF